MNHAEEQERRSKLWLRIGRHEMTEQINSLLTIGLVLALSVICAGVAIFVTDIALPYILTAFEAQRFAP